MLKFAQIRPSVSDSFVSLGFSCRVLHQGPNARPSVRLLVEVGKHWGQRPWSTDGMSGGAEQADILSVLSLVKERWKVVSGVSLSDNRRRVCPAPSPPVPSSPSVPQTTTTPCSSNNTFSCLWVPLPSSEVSHLWLGQFGVVSLCPGRAAAVWEIQK